MYLMNQSERIYNIEETVAYLANKIEKDNRLIISLLKKIIQKIEYIDNKTNIDELSTSIHI